jgi:hypothetical protein
MSQLIASANVLPCSLYWNNSYASTVRKSNHLRFAGSADDDDDEDEDEDYILLRPSVMSVSFYFFMQIRPQLLELLRLQINQRNHLRLTSVMCLRQAEKEFGQSKYGFGRAAERAFIDNRLTNPDWRMCFMLYGIGGQDVWRIVNSFV